MGGASRNEKKRRQAAANQRLAAAGIRPPQKKKAGRNPALLIVGAVVAAAVVVGLAVFLIRGLGDPVEPTYSASLSGAVVTAGSGPVVVDVYEDYLCPECERFEERYGDDVTTALNAGQITVRYHAVAILDGRSDPAGYSTRAADAALCSVPAGIFPRYHTSLFDSQPSEGGAGLTDDELVALGTELGARGDFAGCVRGATHDATIAAETEAAASNPALLGNGGFGTPTVTVGGIKIDFNDRSWLADAIAGG